MTKALEKRVFHSANTGNMAVNDNFTGLLPKNKEKPVISSVVDYCRYNRKMVEEIGLLYSIGLVTVGVSFATFYRLGQTLDIIPK